MVAIPSSWTWNKKFIPPSEARKNRSISQVMGLRCINASKPGDLCTKDTVLITGDGSCLAEDVGAFKAWGVPHDIYCVNRSLLFFQEPINHWAAVDAEESMWFAQYVNREVKPQGHMIYRHTIGVCPGAYNVFWEVAGDQSEYQARLWAGNSGYFAVLTALEMGYERIILAGMPLDRKPHWYEPENETGPNWIGATYTQWIDFKLKHPLSDRVRSMGGYSAFILGQAKENDKC